ncbi:DinB family protein [Candidatus Roizmanbacteria bacterium]|nr:DinB family protein [Candidatus Roizmanbacteria bacterium]
MKQDAEVRKQLVALLQGGQAHMTFEEAVADFPMEKINTKPPNSDYTPWRLLEHIRISQWDILDFIQNSNYKELSWPDEYWPPKDKIATQADWKKTIASIQANLKALIAIVKDPATDLYRRIPHGSGQTILREILLVADHNAYHIGEFAILRTVMQTWPQRAS